jgi:hypothetical protein
MRRSTAASPARWSTRRFEGVVLNAGTHELSVTFTPASANYAASTKTVTLTVTPAATTISWTTPSAIVYGTALTSAQLNATIDGGVAGTLVYTPAEGVVLNAGSHELSVTFTPRRRTTRRRPRRCR